MSDVDEVVEAPEGDDDFIRLSIAVPRECEGRRLDHYLKFRIGRLSRTRIKEIIGSQISLGVRKARASTVVRAGETVTLTRPAPAEPEGPRTFAVLHEDPDFFVIAKPAGLPMHTTAKFWRNTLVAVLRERYPGQHSEICHRIDRETSGVMLIARRAEAVSFL